MWKTPRIFCWMELHKSQQCHCQTKTEACIGPISVLQYRMSYLSASSDHSKLYLFSTAAITNNQQSVLKTINWRAQGQPRSHKTEIQALAACIIFWKLCGRIILVHFGCWNSVLWVYRTWVTSFVLSRKPGWDSKPTTLLGSFLPLFLAQSWQEKAESFSQCMAWPGIRVISTKFPGFQVWNPGHLWWEGQYSSYKLSSHVNCSVQCWLLPSRLDTGTLKHICVIVSKVAKKFSVWVKVGMLLDIRK